MKFINKRYRDIFEQFIHRGEATPFTLGTLVFCAFSILLLIVATFTQLNFSHSWFGGASKNVLYNPQIIVMMFIIYFLGRNYSILTFIIYLIIGLFVWPIFVFGKGIEFLQNYLFGYLLGFLFAIILSGTILNISQTIKARLISGLVGVGIIHLTGFLYCFLLAIFRFIDFNLIFPVFRVVTLNKLIYDLIFVSLLMLIVPYIKNIFWICMRPLNPKKKIKKFQHKIQDNS